MNQTLCKTVMNAVSEADPQALGRLDVNAEDEHVYVSGELATVIEDVEGVIRYAVHRELPNANILVSISLSNQLRVSSTTQDDKETLWSFEDDDTLLDEVSVLLQGSLPIESIETHDEYKRINHETFDQIKAIMHVTGVCAPLVLDKNMKVIDGSLRLEIAKVLEWRKLPCLVLNCDGVKADFIRLTINRTSEFQRWKYDEVDSYVDSVPQLQPLLEPIGFFSNKILPTSFFSSTILQYKIDPYNTQMQVYSQDIGLAEWAEMQRERILKEEERKQMLKSSVPKIDGAVSLFDLEPSEDDFLETHDPATVVQEQVDQMREMAGTITKNFDEEVRVLKEEKGVPWQKSRKGTKQLAAERRAAAMDQDEDLED